MIELVQPVLNCVIFGESDIQQRNVLSFVKITFQDTYSKGLIIFFVSNKLHKSIKNTDIFASLAIDHSPISFTLKRLQVIAKGKGLWIFNSFFTLNKEFIGKIREHASICLNFLEKGNILDDPVRWEYLKYKVRKFFIKFSKVQAKKLILERVLLEIKKN